MKIEEHILKLRANRRSRGIFKERKAYSNKEQKCYSKTFEFFSGIDQFSESVSLTFKGKDSFSTIPGILMSILLLLLIGSYALYEFYQMIFRLNPSITELSLIRDLREEPEFRPYLNSFGEGNGGFDFAFGSYTKIDPTIAYFEVN